MRRLLPALLVAACAGEEPQRPPVAIDLIIREIRPARYDLMHDPAEPVEIFGANFCPSPRVTANGSNASAEAGSATRMKIFGALWPVSMDARARSLAECSFSERVHVNVDCSGSVPVGLEREAVTYRQATGSFDFEVGLFDRTTTDLRAATVPTSRQAGVLLDIAGKLGVEDPAPFIDTHGVEAQVTVGQEQDRTWLSVHPATPLAPGQAWTVTFRAGRQALRGPTECLDFDGERQVTIVARDEDPPAVQQHLTYADGTFRAELDELGAAEYRLLARVAGASWSQPAVVASSRRPQLVWLKPRHDRYCVSTDVVGVPGIGRSEELCAGGD